MDFWNMVILSWMLSLNLVSGNVTENADVITAPVHPVHRRPQPRSYSSAGGRLSLINARFHRRLKPRKKNMDPDQLLDILGDYFDPEWMAIEEPDAMLKENRGSTLVFRRDGWQHVELTEQLRLSNQSAELVQLLTNVTGDPRNMTELQMTVNEFLLKRVICPVRYFWDDIGPSFWPRYIRRGECPQVAGTCSWPPGMHCIASGTSHLHLLRWQCKSAPRTRKVKQYSKSHHPFLLKNKRMDTEQTTNLKCHWIRVPYPITSNCLCSC